MKIGKYWPMVLMGAVMTVIALVALCGLVWVIIQGG